MAESDIKMDNVTYPTSMFSDTTPTAMSHYDDDEYQEDQETRLIKKIMHISSMLVYSVAFLLGTTGNGLVIWIAGFKMKKTVNIIWFVNLAIADFIFTLFLPLSVAYIALDFHWPFGTFMCKLNSSIAFINLFASVFLLTVISVDRCISVVFPVWSQNHRTPRLASFVALAVWFFALCFSLPYFIFRDTFRHRDFVLCYNNFGYDKDNTFTDLGIQRIKATVIIRFLVGFLIPFSVIIFCYTVIALKLQRNRMATSSKPFKIIIAVLISFFVCWFPYHVFSFLEMTEYTNPNANYGTVLLIGTPITSSLAFLNSCVNPFLYVFMGRDFKNKFMTSIQSVFEKAFSEDSLHTDTKQTKSTKSVSESNLV
uniref:Chemokine-like receptor 1 n=1 Tax=Xenopus tropicalis TaxID=8364 RepID=A0A803JYK9_XENTR